MSLKTIGMFMIVVNSVEGIKFTFVRFLHKYCRYIFYSTPALLLTKFIQNYVVFVVIKKKKYINLLTSTVN